MVILVDDEGRENEGDLCCAATLVTPEIVNFMATYGRGLICLSLTEETADALALKPMVHENRSRYSTAFTVSIDARSGVTTGISCQDRAQTILAAVAEGSGPADLVSPGHIFPLRARRGGVLVRPGQTEGSVDLARLAGLTPAGVICEIMNEDGTMSRMPDLMRFAEDHHLNIVSIPALLEYRMNHERLVERYGEMPFQMKVPGEWRVVAYTAEVSPDEVYIALIKGKINEHEDVPVKVHKGCFWGDVLGGTGCDCGERLSRTMEAIGREGTGLLLYVRRGKGGIRFHSELDGCKSDDESLHDNGIEASQTLAMNRDLLDSGIWAQILQDLGVKLSRDITW